MASTSDKVMKKAVDKAQRRAERKQARLEHQRQKIEQAQQQIRQQLALQTDIDISHVKAEHEERILETIDLLRQRKARPDADRICNHLLRKFHVDARDTIAALHKLIQNERVIQVDYKGNTSYRNALKWTRLQLYKNRPEGFCKEKINSSMVAGAVAELVVEEPDYLDQGVPASRLVDQLLDGVSNPTQRRMVEDFLGKEVASGNLARLSNGNYSLVDGSHMSGGTVTVTVPPPIPNGIEIIPKIKPVMPNSPMVKEDTSPYSLSEFEELSQQHSIRGSEQTSSKIDDYMKENCYEIILGKRIENGEQHQFKDINAISFLIENGFQKSNGINQNGNLNIVKEDKKVDAPPSKRSKTERKQRLCVRSDDSSDMLFTNDEFRKDLQDDQDKKDDSQERISDDGDAGRSSTTTSPTPSNANAPNFRSARRKRAKKVFDPSDNMVVKKKRGRQPKVQINVQQEIQEVIKHSTAKEVVKDPNRACSLCSKDKQEPLTACRDCTVRAHPSCIYTPEEMVLKAHTNWQCERCKTCIICYETMDAGPLVTCYKCDDAYHFSCHSPRITSAKNKWHCNDCSQKPSKPVALQNSNSNGSNSNSNEQSSQPVKTSSSTKTSSVKTSSPVVSPQVSPPRNNVENDDENCNNNIDPNIPDATDWTSEQVYQYFARLFPKEAETFRHNDIDGNSLLLMKRSDVLSGLNLLLGPALKIYRHVLKLQVRRDDPKLYWL